MTACVIVNESYKSHKVSNLYFYSSTDTKNYLIPSRVNSSRLTKILIGFFINLFVMLKTYCGRVADTTTH